MAEDSVDLERRMDRRTRNLETRAHFGWEVPASGRDANWVTLAAKPGWRLQPQQTPAWAQGRICADFVFLRGGFSKINAGEPPDLFGQLPDALAPDQTIYVVASHPTVSGPGGEPLPVIRIEPNGEMSLEDPGVMGNEFALGLFGIHYIPRNVIPK